MRSPNAKRRFELYRRLLGNVPGVTLTPDVQGVQKSYQYCAVRIDEERSAVRATPSTMSCQKYNVFSRKYLLPLCSDYPCYRHLPSADPPECRWPGRRRAGAVPADLRFAADRRRSKRICEIVATLQVGAV